MVFSRLLGNASRVELRYKEERVPFSIRPRDDAENTGLFR